MLIGFFLGFLVDFLHKRFKVSQETLWDLIDEIGYIEDVISTVQSLTGLSDVHVVEYAKPFSLANLMGAEAKFGLNIDTKMIDEVTTPRLQYLWSPGK